jgi:hypothetical protein
LIVQNTGMFGYKIIEFETVVRKAGIRFLVEGVNWLLLNI